MPGCDERMDGWTDKWTNTQTMAKTFEAFCYRV